MKYKNPPEMAIVKTVIIMFAILLTIGIVGLVIKWGPYDGWVGFFTMIGIWSCFILAVWYRQFYLRPKIVEMLDDGIVLHMNYTKDVSLKWSEILGYFAYSEDNGAIKINNGAGAIIPRTGPGYTTNYGIAVTVASEYSRFTGRVLPRMELNEEVRKFKKRVLNGITNQYSS